MSRKGTRGNPHDSDEEPERIAEEGVGIVESNAQGTAAVEMAISGIDMVEIAGSREGLPPIQEPNHALNKVTKTLEGIVRMIQDQKETMMRLNARIGEVESSTGRRDTNSSHPTKGKSLIPIVPTSTKGVQEKWDPVFSMCTGLTLRIKDTRAPWRMSAVNALVMDHTLMPKGAGTGFSKISPLPQR